MISSTRSIWQAVAGLSATVLVVLSLTSCGESATEPTPATPDASQQVGTQTPASTTPMSAATSTVASITIISGNSQTGNVGAKLPGHLVVKVKDSSGQPVSGAVVTWTVVSGGRLAVIRPTSTTGALGKTNVTWKLGLRVDTTHVATATVNGFTATFTATPKLPATAKLVKQAPLTQNAIVNMPLIQPTHVCVQLSDGRPVQGATVNWLVTQGGGTVAKPSTKTGAFCSTSVKWTMGGSGANKLQASVTGGPTGVFTNTAVAASRMWVSTSSTDYHTNANWYPATAPTSSDSIFIPASGAYPLMTDSVNVGRIVIFAGARIDLANNQLVTSGSVQNAGSITATNAGAVTMTGSNQTLSGSLPRLKIIGNVHLSGNVTATLLQLSTDASDTARFVVNGHTATINGPMNAWGKIVMNDPADSLIVTKNSWFRFATSRLNAGTMILKGNVNASATVFPAGRIQGQGTNTVVLNGSAAQDVTGNPVFENLIIDNTSGVTFSSSMGSLGTFELKNGSFTTVDNTVTADAVALILRSGTTVNNNGTTQYNTLTDEGATINGNAMVQK